MTGNPYVGPRSIADAEHPGEKIWGRDRETAELADLVIADRIVLVYSPSGAGKTSLLQAGVIPLLRERRFRALPTIRVGAEVPPGITLENSENRYTLSALLSLEEALPKERKTPVDKLARMTLTDYLGEDAVRELLIFDQFEEVLTADPLDVEGREAFFEQLGDALGSRGRWVIFAMREDYLGPLDRYRKHIPTRFAHTFRLDLLTKESALECVTGPAAAAGVPFEREAASMLVENLSAMVVDSATEQKIGAGEYVEPVQLQVVCRRLWDRLDEGTPSVGAGDIGDLSTVDQALSDYYADSVAKAVAASGVAEPAIRGWFGRSLITEQKTRRQVSQSDDATVPVQAALKPLRDSYLIRADRRVGAIWYELAHDRLIRPVLQNNDEHIPELQRKAELWDRQGRRDGLLLAAADLDRLESQRDTGLAKEFWDRSLSARNKRRGARVLQTVVALAVLAALVLLSKNYKSERQIVEDQKAIAAAKIANALAQQAIDEGNEKLKDRQRDLDKEIGEHQKADATAAMSKEAEKDALALATSTNLAKTASTRRAGRFDLAALLSVQAWRERQTPEARFTLLNILRTNPRVKRLLHQDSQIHAIAFGPNGVLASAAHDGSIWLWNLAGGDPVKLQTRAGAVLSVNFNRDGLLAAGTAEGDVQLWDPRSREQLPGPKTPHQGRVNTVRFDAGGRILMSGGKDGVMRFWRVQDRKLSPAVEGDGVPDHFDVKREIKNGGVSLSAGEFVAATTGSYAWSWRLPKPGPATLLQGKDAEAVGIGETGARFLITGSQNVQVWEKGAARAAVYADFAKDGWLYGTAISRDGSLVATSGEGRTIHVYNRNAPTAWAEMTGPESTVIALAFTDDASTLASLSENDRSVWIWSLERRLTLSEPAVPIPGDAIQSVAIDAGGKWLLTTSGPMVRGGYGAGQSLTYLTRKNGAWTVGGSKPLTGTFIDNWRFDWRPPLAASPTGAFVVVGDPSGRVSVRSPNLETEYSAIPSTGQLASLALNRNGTLLAISGWKPRTDLRVYSLLNRSRPTLVFTAPGPSSPLETVVFSPVRDLLAVGGNSMMDEKIETANSEIRLLDFTVPAQPKLLAILPRAEAHSAVFSPDGATLAVAGPVISLWTVPEGRPGAVPRELVPRAAMGGFIPWPRRIRFSPDGRLLALGESDAGVTTAGKRIHILDSVRGARSGEPLQFDHPVDVAGFEPDGKALLLRTSLGIERVPLDPEGWVLDLCRRANRNLSLTEWKMYVGEKVPYTRTCPNLPDGEGVVRARP